MDRPEFFNKYQWHIPLSHVQEFEHDLYGLVLESSDERRAKERAQRAEERLESL